MKQFSFNVKVNFAYSLDAESEQEARDIIKDMLLYGNDLELTDEEIVLDDGSHRDSVLELRNLVMDLRDTLIEYGVDEDNLKHTFAFYGYEDLLDFGKEEWEDDSELSRE